MVDERVALAQRLSVLARKALEWDLTPLEVVERERLTQLQKEADAGYAPIALGAVRPVGYEVGV